jgi:hypothetical protein
MVVGLAALIASLLLAASASAAQSVFFSEEHLSTGLREQPTYIAFGDDTWIEQVAWSSWGNPSADATGVMDSEYIAPTSVSIHVSGITHCGGRLIYSRGTVTYPAFDTGLPITQSLQIACHIAFVTGSNGYITDMLQLVKPKKFPLGSEEAASHAHWGKWNGPVVRGRARYTSYATGRSRTIRLRLSDPDYCAALYTVIYMKLATKMRTSHGWQHGGINWRESCEQAP